MSHQPRLRQNPRECLEGRDEYSHICRLAHGKLELFLCMEGFGSFYKDNVSSNCRPKPSDDDELLDYWKYVLDMQPKRGSWKTYTAKNITEQIESKKDVPNLIRDILDRLARIVEGL